ncbi:tRNA (adenosine(37)-N6)-dimethylallyltransferase MiaA [Leptolyngbya sp. FACHB-261]|uniref:tRNA (adenosine(37)-N6)-dimethylallyltransferase MiaA n=1 Tax=Leptolyngbya sp. FACHB-261 TaxID=2692806 RepID=UPI00168225A7|nr:tRNA (adenosine(37)-N6)-dimethylallyltransferase MiaA [Leptolyngbya sp. FACHB-261]MBD2104497.1 tRNA (adenosine(37)-N6)-dimethylallyltransferase MiaA [Leptolyngbya sp. FACHB-261]
MDQVKKWHPEQPGLVVIVGPTASGKTALAIEVARHLSTVVLSADSRQIYRHFDIGTAKPSVEERQQVPHYLIDIAEPTQTLTLSQYQEQAQALIAQCHAQGQTPVLAGGTGLYIRAVVNGLKIPRVPPHPELRRQLTALGQTMLYPMLQQVDPASAERIHANDLVRTLRALEVFYVTGVPLTQQQGESPPAYPILQLGLDCTDLEVRIRQRTHTMLQQGWLEEVQQLRQRYGADLPLFETLGYREMSQYLDSKLSLTEAQELTVIATRQFAKRQRTWFRADPRIQWFQSDSSDLMTEVIKLL